MGPARSLDELTARLDAVAAENFGAAIGQLVRAIDLWENGKEGGRHHWAEDGPPAWAIVARDLVVRHMEFLAEQGGPQ